MAQTLLIEDNAKLASLYILNFQIYTGTDVIWKKTLVDAMKVLDVFPQLSLVVAKSCLGNEHTALSLYKYIQSKHLSIPFITLGEEKELEELTLSLPGNIELGELIKHVANMLVVTPKKMVEKIIPDFFPIPIKHFLYINKTICDLYIKISQSPSEFHFVKRIPSSDLFSKRFIERYIDKGLEFFYILKKDRINFVSSFSQQLLESLKNDTLTLKERIATTEVAFELIANIFKDRGYSEQNMEIVNAGLKSVMTIISEANKRLQRLLQDLIDLKTGYLFKHIVLTNFLGIHVLTRMSWKREEHISKFAFACFFHDIVLDNIQQAKIKTQDDLDQLMDIDEKKVVNEHALVSAKLVADIPSTPLEVVNIIMHHHGQRDGVGFPEELTSNQLNKDLPLFSYIFMICEAFADIILDAKSGEDNFYALLKELPEMFAHKKFEKIVECFNDI